MSRPPVVVVGAGLAGLACARRLTVAGIPTVLLEAGDQVGGRVRSDTVDGFTIDRGFQVLNTAYPALQETLPRLDLRHLPRGVRVRRRGALHDVPHPFASPTAVFRAASSGAADLRGKLAVARYAGGVLTSTPAAIKRRPDIAARDAWAGQVPDAVARDLLLPFLSGVVLEPEIATSRVFTDLMMRMFALGSSAVPAAGMQALPLALADQLPPDCLRRESPVAEVHRDGVLLRDGSTLDARAVVVATDPWSAHLLVPELGTPPEARGVTTYYFAAAPWSGADPTLTVDADGSGVRNSVILTGSAPEYSTDGRFLIATSVLHDGDAPALLAEAARGVAVTLHEAPTSDWELVTRRDIPFALPAMPAPHPLRKPVHVAERGVWVAGDHRDTSSLQGALVSGARAATSVLREMAARRNADIRT